MTLSKRSITTLDGLVSRLGSEQALFAQNPEAALPESAVAVHYSGSKSLEICGYDVPQKSIRCEPGIRRFQAEGGSIAAITNLRPLRLAYWQSVSNAPAFYDLPIGKVARHCVAVDAAENKCYVGCCCDNKGSIAVFPGQNAPVPVDFLPYALKPVGNSIYCADSSHQIRKLDKKTFKGDVVTQIDNPNPDRIIEDLIVSENGASKVLCAKTSEGDNSSFYTWVNNLPVRRIDVLNNAFDAGILGGRVWLFYGDKSCLVSETPGVKCEQKRLSFWHDIQAVKIDSKLNYVCVATSKQMFMIPFYPAINQLLDDRIKMSGFDTNKPFDNMAVVHTWQ